jgi:signal transduction histidine kinase
MLPGPGARCNLAPPAAVAIVLEAARRFPPPFGHVRAEQAPAAGSPPPAPVTMPNTETLTVAIGAAPAAPARPVLLVVDDEDGPRQSLRIVFKEDYDILLAESGERALELLQHHPVDVAILDIRMTGISGVELLGRIKQLQPAIEVIMLTAYETLETARTALRAGACDYLNKPFEVSTIRAAVARAMRRRQLARDTVENARSLAALKTELEDRKLQEEIARTRGEIYAAVIHDINGPLTIISGFLEVLNQRIGKLNRVEGEDLDFLRDNLSRLTRQVFNCVQISRRYLSFLREKTAEQPPVPVNQILVDLGELLKTNPDAQHNQLLIHMLADDTIAAVNGTDLMQILLNLIVNALQCDAAPHRVEVRGQRLEQPVAVDAILESPRERLINRANFRNEPPLVALSITDNGPGIPPEVATRLFDTQLTTKPVNKGTGLGLAIVHRLVREYHGAIQMKTTPGAGTTFTVYLPAVPPPAASVV